MAKTTSAQRAARTRLIKKKMAVIIEVARNDAFNRAFAMAAKESPKGSTQRTIRWFNEAWVASIRRD